MPVRTGCRLHAEAVTHAEEQQNGRERVGSEIVEMADPAGFTTDAREFTVSVINKIRQNDQKCANIDVQEVTARQIKGAGDADQQAQRGQVIRGNAGRDERRDEPARDARVQYAATAPRGVPFLQVGLFQS